ncbi:oligosaccharide flippase family protein [Vibrio alginolyticus]|uniref:oligosaccharide flippase family protein n=1 Tax=Vibrio alginolyticus TaxID=663 RepID=UPI001BD2FAF3|nr:oligosaccharide flippase family protein [Vibrio alginolyticus]MBS9950504.1 oligosaccharide flippase family protein [Vibrio alginolyticus]
MKKNESNLNSIITSSFYLLIVQGWGYLIPFLIIPLLISRLEMGGFGVIALLLSIVAIFKVAVSYGFDKTAVIDISSNRDNNVRLSQIFSEVLTTRICLILLSFPIYLLIILLMPVTREHIFVSLLMYLVVAAEGIIPQWYYQGIGDLRSLSISRVLQKTTYGTIIYFWVLSPNDLYLIPIIDGLTLVILSLVFLIKPIYRNEIKLTRVTRKGISIQLKRSFDVFISNVFSIIQISTNTIVLGYVCGNDIVGMYAIAEKIYTAIRGLFIPITQAILPRAAKAYYKDKMEYNRIIISSTISYILLSIIGVLFITIYGDSIISVVSKNEDYNNKINDILSLMSIAMLTSVIGISSMKLIVEEKRLEIIKISVSATLINLIIIYPLVNHYQYTGAVLCFIFTQIYILLAQVFASRKKNDR